MNWTDTSIPCLKLEYVGVYIFLWNRESSRSAIGLSKPQSIPIALNSSETQGLASLATRFELVTSGGGKTLRTRIQRNSLPSYMARQLNDMKQGTRKGLMSALMTPAKNLRISLI